MYKYNYKPLQKQTCFHWPPLKSNDISLANCTIPNQPQILKYPEIPQTMHYKQPSDRVWHHFGAGRDGGGTRLRSFAGVLEGGGTDLLPFRWVGDCGFLPGSYGVCAPGLRGRCEY